MPPYYGFLYPMAINPFSGEQNLEAYLFQEFDQLQKNWWSTTRDIMQRHQLWLRESHNLQSSFLASYLEWIQGWSFVPPQPVPSHVTDAVPAAVVEPDEPVFVRDDLTGIQGLGKVLQQRLYDAGVFSFRQIAGWSEADIARVEDEILGTRFSGRIARDQWQAQAEEFLTEA